MPGGHAKYDYWQKSKIDEAVTAAASIIGAKKTELDRLLRLMATWDTTTAELVATLFAAWNDFLIDGKTPTDADIITEVKTNWHPDKSRKFTEGELQAGLVLLRREKLIPRGIGPSTKGQTLF